MFDLIKKIIGNTGEEKTADSNSKQDAHIALCVLLLEAAHVDGECSDEEMEHIVSTLTTECNVSRQDIDELIASGQKERNDSVDLFRFTLHEQQLHKRRKNYCYGISLAYHSHRCPP